MILTRSRLPSPYTACGFAHRNCNNHFTGARTPDLRGARPMAMPYGSRRLARALRQARMQSGEGVSNPPSRPLVAVRGRFAGAGQLESCGVLDEESAVDQF
jgi:hypothetical protein